MNKALDKRIKRHVIAKTHEFFAAVSPGFENTCAREIKNLGMDNPEIQELNGGVQFTGKIHELYKACLNLRTANRILMRLGNFKAASFSVLEKKAENFPWELYLKNIPEVRVSVRHCRLYHSDAVAARLQKAITKRLKEESPDPEQATEQILFIRGEEDRFTISLDASGELLYKRGIKTVLSTAAPIRETIASGILMTAGYDPEKPLWDPMCGSGTFSMEAAMIKYGIPAGWFRDFAFFKWPCFKMSRWKDVRRNAEKYFSEVSAPGIFASDIRMENIEHLEKDLRKSDLDNAVKTYCRDFFETVPEHIPEQEGLVVINPPYGLRIGKPHQIKSMFIEIFHTLEKFFPGWKFAVIAPGRELADAVTIKHKRMQFSHGGLKLLLLTGTIGS